MCAEIHETGGQTDLAAQDGKDAGCIRDIRPDGNLSQNNSDTPLPRSTRRPRRAKADRGLPPDHDLATLATAYLQRQAKLWPKVAEAGLLPGPTEALISEMVEDFKSRHRTGVVNVEAVRPFLKFAPKLGGNYDRYSCDNSNPMSVHDQMIKSLDKAHAEQRFITWSYIFADYSVTGLDASRQGYTSYKKVLADKNHLIETTYIDDFTRASRDEIEWWKLAALSKRLNKRMIGASDGFDVSRPDWEIQVTLSGLFSRLSTKSLREKVRRGMGGAAERGTPLGLLSLGFTRCVRRDVDGNVVCRPDGRPRYKICVDPETKQYRLLAYELFVNKIWSKYKICRHFNKLKVDHSDGWTGKAIRGLLWSPTAIGVFIWNRTRREYDWELEKWVVVKNPRSEWKVHYDPQLAIVPMELWRAARRKLADARRKSPLTGRKPSRNELSATTLFSGTLFCAHCGSELKLIRSTPKYKQMGCLNGCHGTHDCPLSGSKSVRQIEERLLEFLRTTLLTEQRVAEIVSKANVYIELEAQKPQTDVAPLKAEVKRKEAAKARLVRKVEATDDDERAQAYDNRIIELQKEINLLTAEIRKADSAIRKPVAPLSVEVVQRYLQQFFETLNGEIPMAAEAIRVLTGHITIRQEPLPGRKRGVRWIATFSPDFLRLLRHVAKDDPGKAIPTIGGENAAETVEVPIEKVPAYERLAPKFKEMRDNGASVNSIAAAHGLVWQQVAEALQFADTGERPKWKGGKRTGAGTKTKYVQIAEEVATLRESKGMSFAKIAAKLEVGEATVHRAYDYARPDAVRKAAESGEAPRRGSYSHLGEEVHGKIRTMLTAGKKPKEIAAKVGCSTSTVNRIRLKLANKGDESQVA